MTNEGKWKAFTIRDTISTAGVIPVSPPERDFLAKDDLVPAAAAFFASFTRLSLAVTPAATDS